MNNISFPKDLTGYSQREKPVEKADNAILYEPEPETIDIDKTIDYAIVLVEDAITEVGLCYYAKPRKELHDALIHLSMAKNLIKSVK